MECGKHARNIYDMTVCVGGGGGMLNVGMPTDATVLFISHVIHSVHSLYFWIHPCGVVGCIGDHGQG